MKKKSNHETFFFLWKRRKTLLTMKLLLCFILFSMLNVSGSIFSQSATFDLTVNGKTVKEVFKDIESQSQYRFLYNDDFAGLSRVVSFNIKDNNLNEVLSELLSGANLTYRELENELIVITPLADTRQDIVITGRVIDADTGEGLPGANIIVQGTTIGVTTDIEGYYEINLPGREVNLVITYIGYVPRNISIDQFEDNTINIELQPETLGLDEVIVVGYGIQRKANLTGSVSQINFDEELDNRPITNASQALSGTVPGLWVSQNSGQPGSDGATIRIRGYGTLNDTSPLILIDGVEGRIAELNPNDIESITVLKDAASAAIYGSRAANGVILITTKIGGTIDKMSVTYGSYFGFQQLGERYDIIDDSAEFMKIWNQAIINAGGDPMFPADVVTAFENGGDPYLYPSTNFIDQVTRTAPIAEHNLSVSSNTGTMRNYFSLNYLDHEGIYYNTNSNRYSMTFNNEMDVVEWLTIGGRFNVMRKVTNEPYDGIGRVVYMMANGHPYAAPYTKDGEFGATQALYLSGPREGQPITDTRSPMADLHNGLRQYTNNFARANTFANIKIAEGLTLNTQYSAQYNNNLRDRYNEAHLLHNTSGLMVTPLDYPSTMNRERYITDELFQTFFSTLNYNKTFSDNHDIAALLGMQTEDREWKNVQAQKSDIPKAGLVQVSAATSNPIANGTKTKLRKLSYFGRVNYAFKGKYLTEFNLRADASSRFMEGNRWGYFPSASIGWRISEEEFMQDRFFDELKIRASYGMLGNENIGMIWPYLTTISQTYGTSYNIGNALAPGAAVTELVDPYITWETTATTSIGVDMRVLNDRLSAEIDYFVRNTENILVRLPIPAIMGGVTAPYENIGVMRNEGVELNLNWRNRVNNNFSYDVGANLTYVENEVVKFRDDSPDQLYLIRDGYSFQTLYGFVAEGIYQSDEEAASHMHSNSYVPVAGDIRYKDINNDGRLSYEDRTELGNTIPKYVYGVNGGFSYKGFDFRILLQGIAGVNVYTQNAWTAPLGISGGTVTKRWRDAWSPTNQSTETPRIVINDTWNRQQSSFWVNDLSWLKVKNIQFGYALPADWMNPLSIEKAYVFINGQNVFTFVDDGYEGFDPERNTFDSGYNQYPTPRIWSIGVNVTL